MRVGVAVGGRCWGSAVNVAVGDGVAGAEGRLWVATAVAVGSAVGSAVGVAGAEGSLSPPVGDFRLPGIFVWVGEPAGDSCAGSDAAKVGSTPCRGSATGESVAPQPPINKVTATVSTNAAAPANERGVDRLKLLS